MLVVTEPIEAEADAETHDTVEGAAEEPIKMFGDPRSAFVQRGPDRRRTVTPTDEATVEAIRREIEQHLSAAARNRGRVSAVRSGRGDAYSTALSALGVVVFLVSVVAGSIILYNAKSVGAFSDPWDSSRVAIGLVVLGLGIVHAAILLGVARAITYQLAALRLRQRELDVAVATAGRQRAATAAAATVAEPAAASPE